MGWLSWSYGAEPTDCALEECFEDKVVMVTYSGERKIVKKRRHGRETLNRNLDCPKYKPYPPHPFVVLIKRLFGRNKQ